MLSANTPSESSLPSRRDLIVAREEGRRYPPEHKAEAIRLMQHSSLTLEEISARFDIKISALRGWACERMISLRWRSQRTRHPPYKRQDDRDREICELMLSNRVSLAEVAARFGLTREGVRQVALRWSIYRQRPRLRPRAS